MTEFGELPTKPIWACHLFEGDRLVTKIAGVRCGIPIVDVKPVRTVRYHITLSNGSVEIFDEIQTVEVVDDE